jgi:hypothetical protein
LGGHLRTVDSVSLNRNEQRVFDYLRSQPEEDRHWRRKVVAMAGPEADEHEAARRLDGELWQYYVERSGVVEPFRSAAKHEGLERTSMRNLAELLIRLWTDPRPKAKPQPLI